MSPEERALKNAQHYYDSLVAIAKFDSPNKVRKDAQRIYGLSEKEALEFAYENILMHARSAIKGRKRPE